MAEEITVVSSDLERQAKQMRRHILKMIYHAGSGHPVEAISASLDKKLMKKLLEYNEDDIRSLPWMMERLTLITQEIQMEQSTIVTN